MVEAAAAALAGAVLDVERAVWAARRRQDLVATVYAPVVDTANHT